MAAQEATRAESAPLSRKDGKAGRQFTKTAAMPKWVTKAIKATDANAAPGEVFLSCGCWPVNGGASGASPENLTGEKGRILLSGEVRALQVDKAASLRPHLTEVETRWRSCHHLNKVLT